MILLFIDSDSESEYFASEEKTMMAVGRGSHSNSWLNLFLWNVPNQNPFASNVLVLIVHLERSTWQK